MTQTAPRNRMRPWIPAFAATIVLGIAASAAVARPPMGAHDHIAMLEQRVASLKLDESTRNAIYAILDGAKPAQRELQEQMRTELTATRAILEQEAPDETQLMAQVDRTSAVATELRKHQLRTLLAVRAQLTPEQGRELRPDGDGPPSHGRHGGRGH